MDYAIYKSDGSFLMNVTCSSESLTAMIPDDGYSVEGKQSVLSAFIGGELVKPSDEEIESETHAINLAVFREDRNKQLAKTDWTQSNDSPLSEDKKTEWQTYRQALRDMPTQDGFDPLNPSWPEQPS